ncbi:MAG: SDR family oxidoreductase, partial [Alphaproteobacteria bacterium]|nr:SDR family oxidoreductase [Alphaproteobacteria bacterium]
IVNAVIVGAVPLPTAVGTQGTMEDLSVGPAIDPSDVAAAVAQLACDESDYVTGMEIYVDGGYSVTSAR